MDAFDLLDKEVSHQKKNPNGDAFDQIAVESGEPEEPWYKSLARTLYQIPSGIGQGFTYPLDIASMMGTSESLDPEEIEHIKKISEREGIPFDEEKYMEAVQGAQEAFPTQSNIEKVIEEKTGAPLTPKTRLQKGLKFASTAGKISPKPATFRGMNTALPKPVLGAGVEGVREVLIESGIPEPIADLASFAILKQPPEGAPSIEIGSKTKPSGLPERRFEKTTKFKEVSEKKLGKINEKLESDFKDISDKIIKESPVGETFENLKNDPTYKQESRELLSKAQEIADSTEGHVPSIDLKKELVKRAHKRIEGFAGSEYDKSYSKFMNESLNDIFSKEITPSQLVKQYRKNNSGLSEYFEPGSSKALNRAKRDALLDQNRTIADVMEKSFPESELSNIFKEGNQRWTKIMDAEAVDDFVNELFKDGVNYKKMNDFFDKQGYEFKFKRALGEKGYKDFQGLVKDMLTSETPYKMLKVAKAKGFEDLFKTGLAYFLHPKLGAIKLGTDIAKKSYKGLMNSLLDKPQLTVKFKKGLDNLKKGNFAEAEKEMAALKGEIEVPEKIEPLAIEGETIEIKPKKAESIALGKKGEEEKIEFKTENIVKPKELEIKEKTPAQKATQETKKLGKSVEEVVDWIDNKKGSQKLESKIIDERTILKEIMDLKDELSKTKGTTFGIRRKKKDLSDSIVNKSKELSKARKHNETFQKPNLKKVQRPDVSTKGLKKQKEYLIDKLDDAIKNPPETNQVEIDVPGDGSFKINNEKRILENVKEKVKKDWPVKQLKTEPLSYKKFMKNK